MTYTVVLIPAEEGGYTVLVPALPGCVTEGDTLTEALLMAEDAIEGYLAVLAEDGDPIPDEGDSVSVKLGGAREAILRRVVAKVPEPCVA
jgi:antitoxin HicB